MKHISLNSNETMTAKYRKPNEREVAILSKLLHEDFPGVHELRSQVPNINVRTITEDADNYGSIELGPCSRRPYAHRAAARRTGDWRIQTLWRDRDALDKMRAATEAPAAPRLFRSVGADPSLEIFEVMVEHAPDA
jgi:hypothetical protein